MTTIQKIKGKEHHLKSAMQLQSTEEQESFKKISEIVKKSYPFSTSMFRNLTTGYSTYHGTHIC